MDTKEYYVYACTVRDKLVYIGKGKADRLNHCTSGRSSCVELNRDLFKYGIHSFNVFKVVDKLTEKEAYAMEKAVLSWCVEEEWYNRTYGAKSKQEYDEQLALEFWYLYNVKTIKNFRWQDERSIYDSPI